MKELFLQLSTFLPLQFCFLEIAFRRDVSASRVSNFVQQHSVSSSSSNMFINQRCFFLVPSLLITPYILSRAFFNTQSSPTLAWQFLAHFSYLRNITRLVDRCSLFHSLPSNCYLLPRFLILLCLLVFLPR